IFAEYAVGGGVCIGRNARNASTDGIVTEGHARASRKAGPKQTSADVPQIRAETADREIVISAVDFGAEIGIIQPERARPVDTPDIAAGAAARAYVLIISAECAGKSDRRRGSDGRRKKQRRRAWNHNRVPIGMISH